MALVNEFNERLLKIINELSENEVEFNKRYIPIEWIEKYIEDNTYSIVNPKYKDLVFTEKPIDYRVKLYPYQIKVMLEIWREENETN